MPWVARFLSVHRVKDWLSLLGFDTLQCRFLFHRPPLKSLRLLEKLQFLEPAAGNGMMPLAGAYILIARKRTVILTPLKTVRETRRRLFPVGIPTSSQRSIRRAG
jgi:hypothetical protein